MEKKTKTSSFLRVPFSYLEREARRSTHVSTIQFQEDGRMKKGVGGKINVFGEWQHAKRDPRRDCPKETKTPRSRGSREGVFVSLAKGMKNRESQPGFELTRTARAARFLTPPPLPQSPCSTSFHPPVSINRLPGVGGAAGKIATPVSIRWPLPHLGEIVSSVQFKTVARLRFTDRFTLDFRELSFKEDLRVSLPSPSSSKSQISNGIRRWIAKMNRFDINYGLISSFLHSCLQF